MELKLKLKIDGATAVDADGATVGYSTNCGCGKVANSKTVMIVCCIVKGEYSGDVED